MATPYISTRSGSGQWLMQRVSAVLLVGLATVHFSLQHFTSDAVSTGLTVAARLNNPYWQAFYVVFIVLAMYHGLNGVVGILRDYNPPRRLRVSAECTLWALAAFFVILGIRNVVSPVPLGTVKESYAARGFAKGPSPGNPPSFAVSYDFRDELRELALMEYYLGNHVHHDAPIALGTVFAHDPATTLDPAEATASATKIAACGAAFDAWCQAEAAKPATDPMAHPRLSMFSSTREFAVWALNVRAADARLRNDQATLARLASIPAYRATALH